MIFGDGLRALGDVLGEIADALEIGSDADRHHDLAQVARHRLALGDDQDRLLLDRELERVDLVVVGDDVIGSLGVALGQRIDRLGQLILGEPAHLGQHGLEAGSARHRSS